MTSLFDPALRRLRRDRAARLGPALFLADRAFDDLIDNVAMLPDRPGDALLIGVPSGAFVERLAQLVDRVKAVDPSPVLALDPRVDECEETRLDLAPGSFDLIIGFGTLDTVDALPALLSGLAQSLRPGGMLTGFMPGGDTLPRLRRAMRAADEIAGFATPHVHPRIEPSALTGLLQQAGLANAVVEVDRVNVSYTDLPRLVADLRAMGATNVLNARSRSSLSRQSYAAAIADFAGDAKDGRTTEIFELLHFAAWRPNERTER